MEPWIQLRNLEKSVDRHTVWRWGADRKDVLFVGQGFKPIAIGMSIGVVGALGLNPFLSSVLYGVKPNDPLTFVVVLLVLAGVALIAICLPARRGDAHGSDGRAEVRIAHGSSNHNEP